MSAGRQREAVALGAEVGEPVSIDASSAIGDTSGQLFDFVRRFVEHSVVVDSGLDADTGKPLPDTRFDSDDDRYLANPRDEHVKYLYVLSKDRGATHINGKDGFIHATTSLEAIGNLITRKYRNKHVNIYVIEYASVREHTYWEPSRFGARAHIYMSGVDASWLVYSAHVYPSESLNTRQGFFMVTSTVRKPYESMKTSRPPSPSQPMTNVASSDGDEEKSAGKKSRRSGKKAVQQASEKLVIVEKDVVAKHDTTQLDEEGFTLVVSTSRNKRTSAQQKNARSSSGDNNSRVVESTA